MGDAQENKELCLLDLISHIAIEVCGKNPFAQGEKYVFVKTAGVVDGFRFAQELQLSFAVVLYVGTQPQSPHKRAMS